MHWPSECSADEVGREGRHLHPSGAARSLFFDPFPSIRRWGRFSTATLNSEERSISSIRCSQSTSLAASHSSVKFMVPLLPLFSPPYSAHNFQLGLFPSLKSQRGASLNFNVEPPLRILQQQSSPSDAKCDTKPAAAVSSAAASLSFLSLSDRRTEGRPNNGLPSLLSLPRPPVPLSINAAAAAAAAEAVQLHSLGASEAVARARARIRFSLARFSPFFRGRRLSVSGR